MTHIKKLVIQGFKSFAPKTEINFDTGINVIVGPNGSGKSNISDALCFVLGRLSIKSMRAAKAKNLLFMGSKYAKPAKEASVEIVFDNANNTFNMEHPEVSLKRIVRHNGQSIYKLNDETRTRGEIMEILAHAGIDPYGYNLVLQGQIQSIVKTHPEERRKIIEEVAGISIYEMRKEKSLKELEKTDQRLKEISTILRERTSFMRNLEKERAQALRYKEFETTISRCKVSILSRKIQDKDKEVQSTKKSIEEKIAQKDKKKSISEKMQEEIEKNQEEITRITKHVQRSTGVEQESLRTQISNLKAETEGLRVRKESYENRRDEIERRIQEMEKSIPENKMEIEELRKESPLVAQKQNELQKKKKELQELEEEKKKIYSLKTELSSIKERIKDKENHLAGIASQSDSIIKRIEEISGELNFENIELCKKELSKLKSQISKITSEITLLSEKELSLSKQISSAETTILHAEKMKFQIEGIDICPLCQNKMTESHRSHVHTDSETKISEAKKILDDCANALTNTIEKRNALQSELASLNSKISKIDSEMITHNIISDKKSQIKALLEQEGQLKQDIKVITSRRDSLQAQTSDTSRIDEKYSSKIMEIEEISSRTEEDLDRTLMFKERELEKITEVVKLSKRDLSEIDEDIREIYETIENKAEILEKKEIEDKELSEKFKQMFAQRDKLQEFVQDKSYELSNLQNEIRQIEDQINFLNIGNARLSAEKEALEMEIGEFSGIEIIKGNMEFLEDRLKKAQEAFRSIGPINMRALEVYENVKEEYDKIYEKVQVLESEKSQILKIIEEIDNKKKKTFMKTFKGLNELFSTNFSKLSTKGQAFLELEDKENIFDGGVNIVVKLAKTKYFDVTSLSGGEQTLIAISLLFAIQEYRPYHFYVLDEIDAALDKRNSERLSALLRKYMTNGQYIVVTHNDALIMDSNILYGVSMHDGISKILGLKI